MGDIISAHRSRAAAIIPPHFSRGDPMTTASQSLPAGPGRRFLDMNGYQWTVLFAAWLGWGFDVFDGLLFNYVAPNAGPTLLRPVIGPPRAHAHAHADDAALRARHGDVRRGTQHLGARPVPRHREPRHRRRVGGGRG